MIQRLRALIPYLILCLALSACQANTGWRTVTSNDGRFSAEMPGPPVLTSETRPSEWGTLTVYLTTVRTNNNRNTLLVAYTDMPAPALTLAPDELVRRFTTAGLDASGGTLLTQQNLKLDDQYPGLEITISDNVTTTVTAMRTYMVHERLYQLVTVMPASQQNLADTSQFMLSFKLLP